MFCHFPSFCSWLPHAHQKTKRQRSFAWLGEYDLGVRLQGTDVMQTERTPASWCVITEDDTERTYFSLSGLVNPDMDGTFALSYFPPDRLRIINAETPPDVEFVEAAIGDEAGRQRRMDPFRLLEELHVHPEWITSIPDAETRIVQYPGSPFVARIHIQLERLQSVETEVDLPLRGRVPIRWVWDWDGDRSAQVSVHVDTSIVFLGRAQWRDVRAEDIWTLSGGEAPRELPGDYWPSRVAMQMDTLSNGVYRVLGVRTGFHHLVVDTDQGLVIGDAPAGWVELSQIPPADLVPGLGISGLSESFIDFLYDHFPDKPIRAVAITHAHDDHAGGARAFAAVGAQLYATAPVVEFLETALQSPKMPPDWFSSSSHSLGITPVESRIVLNDSQHTIELMDMGSSPHVSSALGIWVRESGYFFQSDLHVPSSDDIEPPASRAATECWFAQWAVDNLPLDTMIMSSHTTRMTPVSRLAERVGTEVCQVGIAE